MAQKSPFDDPWINPFTPTSEESDASLNAPYLSVATPPSLANPPSVATPRIQSRNDPVPSISTGRMKRLPSGPATIPITSSQSRDVSNAQSELSKRQAELDRKEQELSEREEELKRSNVHARMKNWPPIPPFWIFGPCFFQDISLDIPQEFQRIVRIGYYLWLFGAVTLFLNFLGLCAVGSIGPVFGSLFIFFICTPLSYICWFRPLYNAFRSDSSFNFMLFFFFMFLNLIIGIIWAVGVPWTASCGFITAAQAIQDGAGKGIFAFIVAAFLTVNAIGDFYFLLMVHQLYRSTGASFNKAKAEFVASRTA